MKKIIFGIIIASGLSFTAAHAQQMNRQAILHPDGKVTVESLPTGGTSSGKETETAQKDSKITQTGEQHNFVSHEAVLLKDGSQEIRLIDASGKVTVITANKGESIQAKYIDYLVKNHLPCACGGSSMEKEQPAQIATRPSQALPDSMKK